jgi:aldehyde dehydrogenase (NAD+)
MTAVRATTAPVRHGDRLFIDGAWVEPSSDTMFDVIDSGTEELYYRVAAAGPDDLTRAVAAARHAFDDGPWRRITHAERADVLRAFAAGIQERGDVLGQLWPRETGTVFSTAQYAGRIGSGAMNQYAALADTFPWEEECPPTIGGEYGLLVREPVGVVGAIIPWNAPVALICHKIAPALLAGCTVVLKSAPEAPGEGYVFAEVAEEIGLPPGVLNVVTADRDVSELLVRHPDVDKITFTGSTAAGRRIASLCGERIARCTLELGGKSAAVILDDMDLETAATTLARAECGLNGQVCSSLTRIIVTRDRHDEMVDALAAKFSQTRVGDPFDEQTQLGPLVSERQRDRVEGYIAAGVAEGATLAAGGARPQHLDRGYYVAPTVFGNVDNHSTIGRAEIFGPVLSVIAADDEQDAVRIANDTIYGLNASVFTPDVDRARAVARELRSGTVGHNAFRTDFGMAFGGFKQSGIGREGGREGVLPFLETKAVILEGIPGDVSAAPAS